MPSAPVPRRRPILVLTALLLAGSAACSEPGRAPRLTGSTRLPDAVRRTLDAGTARVVVHVVPARGRTIVVEGLTSLVGPDADVVASIAGDPSVPPAAVRMTAAGVWLRPPGLAEWTEIDTSMAHPEAPWSWKRLLGDLARATAVQGSGRRLTALVDGAEVAVDIGEDGRIASIRRQRPEVTIELALSDFGIEVVVTPP